MSIFKRVTATIRSRVDAAVTRIEDHEAVIDAAIGEARQAVAKGRVRLARVQKDGEALEARIQSLKQDAERWEARARRLAAEDETKALECLRRRNEARQQLTATEQAQQRHRQIQTRLEQDVRAAEERLNERIQQRNLMRTRSSTTEALRAMADADADEGINIDAAFERWEVRLTESELEAGTVSDDSLFEHEFRQAEDQSQLRAELDELLKGKE